MLVIKHNRKYFRIPVLKMGNISFFNRHKTAVISNDSLCQIETKGELCLADTKKTIVVSLLLTNQYLKY